ncbi:MAG: hypothetical protein IJ303_04310 [Clostridia bacterium]|nr:hypothetical protein [Clostridia bacterium]
MSKVADIREICGDYALDIEYSKDYAFTMFFNSRRNAETVKRCIEVDDSVPNVATAVDFVEVVRCRDCKSCDHCYPLKNKGAEAKEGYYCDYNKRYVKPSGYCSHGERREDA